MRPAHLFTVLDREFVSTKAGHHTPVMLWGPPGVGKSQLITHVAEKHVVPIIDVRLSQMEPSDLRGIPFRNNDKVEWATPAMLPDAERHGEQGILFLDEITSAPPSVSAAAYQLILDRKLGEYEVPKGLIILTGTEPQLRWRTYCDAVVQLASQHDVSLVVSLGALIADVVHTRPTTIYGASYDPALCEELDLEPSGYEGPTGIVGVVHDAFNQAQMGSVSLWGTVPSYVPHAPSPKAAMALVNRVAKLVDIEIPVASLESSSQVYEKQITDLVSDDLETQEYVADLEARYDEAIGPGSGEALISELEEFLRDQS